MRFKLVEANRINYAKRVRQDKDNSYANLNSDQRHDFILDWVKERPNYKTLKPAQASIVNIIQDTNWDKEFMNYINKIQDVKLTDEIVETIGTLLVNKKIKSSNRDWLYNKDLYDRNLSDALFTIKAFTFADNTSTQVDDSGSNKYFDENNPIKISDFKSNGKIKSAAEIKDIIDSKQTKGFRNVDDSVDSDSYKTAIEMLTPYYNNKKEDAIKAVSDVIKQGVPKNISVADLVTKVLNNKK